MRRAFRLLFTLGALTFLGCQQTQEADDDADADGTTVIKEETTVLPAEEPAGTDVDIDVQGGEDGAAGSVDVEAGGGEN